MALPRLPRCFADTMDFSPTKTPKGKTPAKGSRTPCGDRFIPNRAAMERSLSSFNLDRENEPVNTQNSGVVVTPKKEHYRDTLTNSLFNKDEGPGAKILAFKSKAPAPKESHQNSLRVLYSQNKSSSTVTKKANRHIPQVCRVDCSIVLSRFGCPASEHKEPDFPLPST